MTLENRAKEPVLELRRITKSYPGVVALDKVDFAVNHNEIVGLIGENGAGKSTLMKILIGLIQPDDGLYKLRGERITLRDPANAARHGVASALLNVSRQLGGALGLAVISTIVASSAIVIWKPPSPTTTQTSASGRPTFAPMAAGSANPIVPRPPDVMSERGASCL